MLRILRRRISAFAATAGLFAAAYPCSAGSANLGLFASRGSLQRGTPFVRGAAIPDGHGSRLYVSNFYAADVVIYPAAANDPPVVRTISQGLSNSYNLAVDGAGTLYVQGNNNTISEFAHGGEKPTKVLTEPKIGLGTCVTLAVGADGTVYSADLLESQLYEFATGSTTPTTTINLSHPFGIALDSSNNLYVGYTSSPSGFDFRIMEFAPGQTTGKDLGIQVSLAGGINVDKHNNLLVGDQGTQVIDIFKPGKTQPFRQISTAPYYPYQFAFDEKERYVYLVSGTPAAVYVYDYKTGAFAWSDSQGLSPSGYAEGVALSPAASI